MSLWVALDLYPRVPFLTFIPWKSQFNPWQRLLLAPHTDLRVPLFRLTRHFPTLWSPFSESSPVQRVGSRGTKERGGGRCSLPCCAPFLRGLKSHLQLPIPASSAGKAGAATNLWRKKKKKAFISRRALKWFAALQPVTLEVCGVTLAHVGDSSL